MGRLELSCCVVDLDREAVERDDATLKLTTREAEVLRYLAARPGDLVSREDLLVDVWDYAPTVVTRAVDSTCARLRKKIERDPKQPEHLQTVYGGGYRLRLARSAAAPSRLPADVDVFVGRSAELATATELLETARLVTLVGPAGAGKSRLALQLARGWEEQGGAALHCRLEAARSALELCLGVAGQLGMSLGSAAEIHVGAMLARLGPALVVLDDLEHALEHLPDTLGRWLEAAPEVRFVATSREALRLRGEHLVELGPLPHDDALALWTTRVRQVRPDYEPDQPELDELLGALDRLPLALEMAAARMDVLDVKALVGLMGERFRLLLRREGGPARQASLEAALEGSWSSMASWEQAAVRQLGAFRGGFGLEAATAVLALDGDAPWAPDVLAKLQQRSLLQRVDRGGAPRYDLYRSVEAYALREGADEGAAGRHRAWFARWGGWLDALRTDPVGAAEDIENLLTALDGAEGEEAVPLARATWAVVSGVGPYPLGLRALKQARRAAPDAAEELAEDLAEAEARLGHLAGAVERLAADSALRVELLIELARLDDARTVLSTGVGAARLALLDGDVDAAEDLLERPDGVVALAWSALAAAQAGRLGEARRRTDEVEAAGGTPRDLGRSRVLVAAAEVELGRPGEAVEALERAELLLDPLGEQGLLGQLQLVWSLATSQAGRHGRAVLHARRAVDLAGRGGFVLTGLLARRQLVVALEAAGEDVARERRRLEREEKRLAVGTTRRFG